MTRMNKVECESRLDLILALERKILDGLVTGDTSAENLLISEDFVGIYPDEITNKSGHLFQLLNGPIISKYSLDDPKIIDLSPNVVCLYYKVRMFSIVERSEQVARVSEYYETSIWKSFENDWRNIFSQSTIVIR